jgi:hypothetical protein
MKTYMRFRGYFEFNSQYIYRRGKHFEQDVVGKKRNKHFMFSILLRK